MKTYQKVGVVLSSILVLVLIRQVIVFLGEKEAMPPPQQQAPQVEAPAAPVDAPPVAEPPEAPEPEPEEETQPILNIPALVGQPKEKVAAELGKPSECWKEGPANFCYYKDEGLKVGYIKKKADRFLVTFDGAKRWGFSAGADALPELGIAPAGRPGFSNDFLSRWSDHDGFREITVEDGNGGKASKILIKAKHGDEAFQ